MENSFDTKAATWDDNPRRIQLVEKVEAALRAQITFSQSMHLLDYGCGTGLLGFKYVNDVNQVTFCDTSSGMLEQVKQKIAYYGTSNARILQSDFSNPDELSATYDIITSMLVLHHVEKLEDLLLNFHRSLHSEGLFCWIDLDKEDGSFHNDASIPHLGFDKDEMIALLQKTGFEPIHYYKKIQVSKDTEEGLKLFPLFVLIAKKLP
jgi:predicted TPR repeat methyltransferase